MLERIYVKPLSAENLWDVKHNVKCLAFPTRIDEDIGAGIVRVEVNTLE